jgi:hypothetical protein
MGPTCTGDPVIGTHICAPIHWIDMHGSAVEGIKGAHDGRACLLNRRASVQGLSIEQVHTCARL